MRLCQQRPSPRPLLPRLPLLKAPPLSRLLTIRSHQDRFERFDPEQRPRSPRFHYDHLILAQTRSSHRGDLTTSPSPAYYETTRQLPSRSLLLPPIFLNQGCKSRKSLPHRSPAGQALSAAFKNPTHEIFTPPPTPPALFPTGKQPPSILLQANTFSPPHQPTSRPTSSSRIQHGVVGVLRYNNKDDEAMA